MKFLFQLLIVLSCGASLFGAIPVVTSISPSTGVVSGGETITITGTGFTDATSVHFGTLLADGLTVESDTSIIILSPENVPCIVDVTVTTPDGTSSITRDDLFTYLGNWICYMPQSSPARLVPLNIPDNTTGTAILSGGTNPGKVAITADGRLAVVSNRNSNNVSVVDLITHLFSLVSVGSSPFSVAITPDSTTAYITNQFSDTVSVIDITGTPSLITTITVGTQPQDIAITPDGLKAYVTCREANSVNVISTASNTVTAVIPFPSDTRPGALAITPDGTKAYVAEIDATDVAVISTATDTIIGSPIALGESPNAIAIAPDGLHAYVSCSASDNFKVIDIATDLVVDSITIIGSNALAITPDSLLAYVTSSKLSNLMPIDLITLTPGSAIAGFGGLLGQKISPDQAPLAKFTAIPADPGLPTSFDASASVSPVGTITTYDWDFGDSATETTSSPTTTHTYAAAGTYTVTLIVTNSGTTSTAKVYTSQLMSNNGNDVFPVLSQSITIGSPPPSTVEPPSDFHGKIYQHKRFFTLHSKWKKSPSTDVISYQVYANSKLIKTVAANSKLHFYKKLHPRKYYFYKPHHYKKFLRKKYKVRAVGSTGIKSSFINLQVKLGD